MHDCLGLGAVQVEAENGINIQFQAVIFTKKFN